VGAGTVLADDPKLTVRLDDFSGTQPLPVVVAGSRVLSATHRVFASSALVYSPMDRADLGSVEVMPDASGERVDLANMLDDLGARGVVDLLVEGGPTLAGSFWRQELVDRGVFYVAGALAGGRGHGVFNGDFATIGELRPIEITGVDRIGPDLRVEFEGVA
jgi:diaminohydroxyphosphoribosylaminopyrimidine deaminase/5-amino-6-(5-phosphoribosylamino)uracil reductase